MFYINRERELEMVSQIALRFQKSADLLYTVF